MYTTFFSILCTYCGFYHWIFPLDIFYKILQALIYRIELKIMQHSSKQFDIKQLESLLIGESQEKGFNGNLTFFSELLPHLAFINTEGTFVVSTSISILASTYSIAADSARFMCKLISCKHVPERLMLTQYDVMYLLCTWH